MLLVFIYNSPGLIEDFNLELLPVEPESLTTVSCAFYIYSYNYLSFKIISQPYKNISFFIFITKHVKILLHSITALLRKLLNTVVKRLYKLRHLYKLTATKDSYKLNKKFITKYGSWYFAKLLMIATNFVNFYYKSRHFLKLYSG